MNDYVKEFDAHTTDALLKVADQAMKAWVMKNRSIHTDQEYLVMCNTYIRIIDEMRRQICRPVIIQFDGEEYRVPSPDNSEAGAYYTDDWEDAQDTAYAMYRGIATIRPITRRVEYFGDTTD